MTVSRVTPYAVNGVYVTSLASPSANVPAKALLVSSFFSQANPGTVSVTDNASNTWAVRAVLSGSHGYEYQAYCLSANANAATVVTWHCATSSMVGIAGCAYVDSAGGTWSFDSASTPNSKQSAYATAASLTFPTAGAGVIAGIAGEYYSDAAVFTNSGVAQQAYVNGSSSTYAVAVEHVDAITTAAQSSFTASVSDNEGGYGGYISLYLGSFLLTAGGGGSNALAGTSHQAADAAGQLSVAVPLHAVAIQAQGASGGITVLVPLAGSSAAQQQASGTLGAGVALSGNAVAKQQVNGSLSISVPLSASSVQQALARAALAVGIPLAGSSAQQPAASGSLSIHVSLAGEQLQQAIAAATLTNIAAGAIDLAGSSGQQQGASGRLSVTKNLSGATLAIQGASGSLALGVPLSGTSVQASRATGALAVGVTLSGASLQQALASAALSNVGAIDLSGASSQQQAGAGTLQLQIHLTAEALQQVAAVATLGVSTIPTYQGTGRFYAAAPAAAFYAAPALAFYAAALATSYYAAA